MVPDVERMSPTERAEIARLCDEAMARYLEKRARRLTTIGARRSGTSLAVSGMKSSSGPAVAVSCAASPLRSARSRWTISLLAIAAVPTISQTSKPSVEYATPTKEIETIRISVQSASSGSIVCPIAANRNVSPQYIWFSVMLRPRWPSPRARKGSIIAQ